jgi:hypothetical protein
MFVTPLHLYSLLFTYMLKLSFILNHLLHTCSSPHYFASENISSMYLAFSSTKHISHFYLSNSLIRRSDFNSVLTYDLIWYLIDTNIHKLNT